MRKLSPIKTTSGVLSPAGTVASVVTTKTNATSRRRRARSTNAKRRNARKRKHLPGPPRNGDKDGKGGGKGGGKSGGKGGNPNSQRRSSAPAFSPGSGDVNPKKSPEGDNTSPEASNSKKRRPAWKAKSLMAAGAEVKFPAEE